MESKLQDVLILASRVAEKRGDLRSVIRGDPSVQPEVHFYLDDLSFLSTLPLPRPRPLSAVAGKQRLLASLAAGGQRRRRRRLTSPPLVGAVVSFVLLMVSGLSVPAATHTPVLASSLSGVLSSLGLAGHAVEPRPASNDRAGDPMDPTAPAIVGEFEDAAIRTSV